MLGILILVTAFLLAVAIPVGVVYFGWRSFHDPVAGVSLVLWLFLAESAVTLPALPLGISVFPGDLVFMALAGVALFRLLLIKQYSARHLIWLLLGAILTGLFVLGLFSYKTVAGVEFRAVFGFWAGAFYLMTFDIAPAQLEQIGKAWVRIAALLTLVALFRWIAMGLHLSIVRYWNEGGASLRVLPATQALFIAQAFLIVLYAQLRDIGPRWWRCALPVFFVCIVLLQHRSVWVNVLFSVTCLYLFLPALRRQIGLQLVLGMIAASVLILPLYWAGKLDKVTDSLEHSVQEVRKKNSTIAWRVDGWKAALDDWSSAGPAVYLFGKPFGAGFSRYSKELHKDNNVTPHNFYVLTLLRGGVIGLLCLLASYGLALRQVLQRGVFLTPASQHLLAILLSGQLVYFITYSAHYIEFVMLGVTFNIAALALNKAPPQPFIPHLVARNA